MNNNRLNNLGLKIYLLLALLPIILFVFTFVYGQKNYSYIEYRYMNKIPSFKLEDYLKGDYQKNLESSFADQIPFSDKLKTNYKMINNILADKLIKFIGRNMYCNNYIQTFEQFYSYNCDNDYLITLSPTLEFSKRKIDEHIASFNKLAEYTNIYFYFIENDYSNNFVNINHIFYNYFVENMKIQGFDHLKINTFDDYKKFFYKTDHHWNKDGSYQGYIDIIKLLISQKEEILIPNGIEEFDCYFDGSRARVSSYFKSNEKFDVYTFNLPTYTTYIDGNIKVYGNKEKYFTGNYLKMRGINHYNEFYGSDYGEIIFDFNNKEKENLLIFSSSFSNPINELIASHFNKTYVIDNRHYDNFNMLDYIEKNDINKVLILEDLSNLLSQDFLINIGGIK